MSNIILSLQQATIRCAGQPSFSDISFEIKKGEHWLLTGENEALITALIQTFSGRLALVKGSLQFPFIKEYKKDDKVVDPPDSWQKLIVHVSARHHFRNLSNTSQFYYQQRFNSSDSENSLTTEQYLSGIAIFHEDREKAAQEIIKHLKLDHLRDEQLIKLSNGETRRVLIAAALLRQPVILLLSNPLAGLDVQSRAEMEKLICHVAASDITIIMAATAKSIPAAITHVAVVDKENKLETFKKEAFNKQNFFIGKKAEINQTELKALLSLTPMAAFTEVVTMKNVTIRYGNRLILDKINWKIRQGEKWALTGHNGAGKSTLLSLINGDNPQAFANDIILFDRRKGSGESIWDIKEKIGFFSPELYQYFPLETLCLQAAESGFYNTTGLFKKSNPRLAAIARRWLELLGVGHLTGKLLKQVAPVEQRLCLLARALVKSAPLLILDEPCQGFNESQQVDFKELLNKICSLSNVTLIYVSHYEEEIPDEVTKVFKLKDGKQME